MRGGRKRMVGAGLVAGLLGLSSLVGVGDAGAQEGPIAVITPPGGPFGTEYELVVTCEDEPDVLMTVQTPSNPSGDTVPVELADGGDGTWSLRSSQALQLITFEVTCGDIVERVGFLRDEPVASTTTTTSTTTVTEPTEPPATPSSPPAAPAAAPITAAAAYTG